MLTKETKRRIDSARDILVGQLPLPSDQVELITIALIYKFMDDIDEESRELGGKPSFFIGDLRDLSWRKLISNTLSADERVTKFIQGIEAVSKPETTHIPNLFKSIFRNAFLKFRDGRILKLFLDEINGFDYGHSEELGNAFEYLLDTMGAQGKNGQFRTPRNIIEFIVDAVDPQKGETILDPACGTGGFLISAFKHILAANTSARLAEKDVHAGDKLKPAERKKLADNIAGYDITPLMCRLSRVNMYLHHFANPVIHEYDTLTNPARWGEKADVILANPPFMSPSGGIKPHNKFRIPASRAEVLFADFILEHLAANGRAGFIVPEGIIFQNNGDYVSLRQWLINEAGLWAVVSLPAQIFQPYSGVKTSVLLIDRALARQRQDVLLVKVENDGFSLNTNRTPIAENDLPAALELLETAKQPDYKSAIENRKSAIQCRVVPRVDFAKLDAYKASSSAYDFCRKFFTHAEKLKTVISLAPGFSPVKSVLEAKAAASAAFKRGGKAVETADAPRATRHTGLKPGANEKSADAAEAVKAEKALEKVREEFAKDTGLGKLPATEAELKARFDKQLKAAAVAYGDLQPAAALTAAIKERLDGEREFSLSFDKTASPSNAVEHLTARLEEVCEFKRGPFGGALKKEIFVESGYKIYEQKHAISDDFTNGRYYIDDAKFQEMKAFELLADDIILSCSGTIGRSAIFPKSAERGIINQALLRLRPNRERILPKFLKRLLDSPAFQAQLSKGAAGVAIQNVASVSEIKGFLIPVPPLEEQRAIVAELEGYQRVVDGCRAVLDHYRPSFIASPDWPTDTLGHHFSRVNELCDPQTHKSEIVNYVGLENLESQTGRLVGEIRHSPKTVKSTKVVFCPGDILYGKLRPNLNKVWLADREGICSTDILVFRAKSNKVIPGFFAAFFRQLEFNARVMAGIEGAQLPRVNFDHMAGLEILLPPVEEQKTIFRNIEREQATLAGLAELRAKYAAKIAARLAGVWGSKK
jgi:type I restriction enzyme M protein